MCFRLYGIRNFSPRAAEAAFYGTPHEEGRNGRSYARIALTPNLAGSGKALMLAGHSAEASEGAEDAALAPDLPGKLGALFGNRPLHDASGFELLLEVDCVDGVVRGTKVLAHRMQ